MTNNDHKWFYVCCACFCAGLFAIFIKKTLPFTLLRC